MTRRMRTWIGLTMLVVAAGCAGSRTSSSAEVPVVNELVRLADSGGLDQERLSCAASWLAEGIAADNASSGAAAPVRSPDYAREGAREAARQAEHAAAVTVRAGGAPRAAFYHSYVDDLLSAARDRSARRAPRGNANAGPSAEARDLFEEYASLWALLLATPQVAAEQQARVAKIDEIDPHLVEAYTQSLLHVYQQPALSCGVPPS